MKPQFSNLSEFLNMDGYAGYVFAAYGLSVFVIFGLLAWAIIDAKQSKARLLKLEELKKAGN
jgi:heme exporter protein CcmD